MDSERLRAVVRERVVSGVLPREKCLVTWFGPGTGKKCDACMRPIGKQEIECECDHPRGGVIRFHQACYAIWEQEQGEEPCAIR